MTVEQLYHSSENRLNEVKHIYLASFPADERRPFAVVRRYLKCSRRPFHILAAVMDDRVASFISYWEFPEFRYIEHFATLSSLRGDGIGSWLLHEFLHKSPLPVILEVELPDNDLAKRRIEYYVRQGFSLHDDFHYIQPPY
ncbi:MAG: GNAT family N-acetyltransferase, partial [Muribaculaceae bacterium]|nr:GNAT family N-acetyltransferase [Muribaculaceae bacterium]